MLKIQTNLKQPLKYMIKYIGLLLAATIFGFSPISPQNIHLRKLYLTSLSKQIGFSYISLASLFPRERYINLIMLNNI